MFTLRFFKFETSSLPSFASSHPLLCKIYQKRDMFLYVTYWDSCSLAHTGKIYTHTQTYTCVYVCVHSYVHIESRIAVRAEAVTCSVADSSPVCSDLSVPGRFLALAHQAARLQGGSCKLSTKPVAMPNVLPGYKRNVQSGRENQYQGV